MPFNAWPANISKDAAVPRTLDRTNPLTVIQTDGSHPLKAGPCASCGNAGAFLTLQSKLSRCLSGARLAKDRAAETVSTVIIPEALDYPQ